LLAAAATRLHQPQLTDPGTGEICAQRERDRGLRVIIIDESAARAAVIEEGLREAGVTDIRILTDRVGMIAAIAAAEPDVVLMNLENPSRDVLEESFLISRSLRKPIAMFVDQSDAETMMAAIDAGVSVRRFQAFSRLQDELAEARSQLAERKTIDQAKAILMRKRGISEPEAYKLLRSHAMATNRRVAEVAQALITADAMLGGGL
jgi:response regulator NasT